VFLDFFSALSPYYILSVEKELKQNACLPSSAKAVSYVTLPLTLQAALRDMDFVNMQGHK